MALALCCIAPWLTIIIIPPQYTMSIMTRSFQEKKLLMIKSDTHLSQSKPSAILEVITHFVPYSLQHSEDYRYNEAKPKCVCLPFSELILSLPNKNFMIFHWLKICFHCKIKKMLGCNLERICG